VVTALIWTYAYGGQGEALRAGILSLPLRGLLFGLAMGIRLTAFLAAGMVFLATTRIEAFAAALRRLGLPYTAGFVLTLAFRLVPVFVGTALTVAQAHRARGYDLEGGRILTRWRRKARLVVPILLGGLRNADGMALALEARGFAPGSHPRRSRGATGAVLEYKFGVGDLAAALSYLLLILSIAWLRASGWGAL
jgi:energy-coupling factor transport system permease protein